MLKGLNDTCMVLLWIHPMRNQQVVGQDGFHFFVYFVELGNEPDRLYCIGWGMVFWVARNWVQVMLEGPNNQWGGVSLIQEWGNVRLVYIHDLYTCVYAHLQNYLGRLVHNRPVCHLWEYWIFHINSYTLLSYLRYVWYTWP